jgi:hypothetical protein
MANSISSSEAAAIDSAYGARLQSLFTQLATNLGDHVPEQQSLDRFNTGLSYARRARQLALSAVPSSAPLATTQASRTRKRKSK